MIERRIKAVFRKYKLSGLALISMLGLASIFAVNLAGFLVLLPRPLWGLIDAAFVSSYFMRLSILLALAILASRYSVYFVSAVLGLISWVFVIISLLTKKAGRRLIRIKGYQITTYMVDILSRRHENEVKHDNDAINFEAQFSKFFEMRFARTISALFYFLAYTQGQNDVRVKNFTIPIQILTILLVLSALFTTFSGALLLVILGIILLIVIPPKPTDFYFDEKYFESGVSFFAVQKYKPWKILNLQKITLLVLSLSFVSGTLHHRSLLEETRLLKFLGEVSLMGTLVLASSSGFIIHSGDGGYQFIPIEGTRIEVLPVDYETSG